MPNLGQIGWFLEPCDLEIWRITLQYKLYNSFVSLCFDISQQDELCGEHTENTDDL